MASGDEHGGRCSSPLVQKKWREKTNNAQVWRQELEPRTGLPPLAPPDDAESYAGLVAAHVPDGRVSATWICTGQPVTPAAVQQVAAEVFDATAKHGRMAPAPDETWPMVWTPRQLLPLLTLVAKHANELPLDVRHAIMKNLCTPFAAHLKFAPLLVGADPTDIYDDERIRDVRAEMLFAMAKAEAIPPNTA